MDKVYAVETSQIEVSMNGAAGDDFAFILLRSNKHPNVFGVGYAVRHPDDEPDPSIGAMIAAGRAMTELGLNMEEHGLRQAGVDV